MLYKRHQRVAWLSQSVEHVTLYPGVMSWSPTLNVEITLKENKRHQTQMTECCVIPFLQSVQEGGRANL